MRSLEQSNPRSLAKVYSMPMITLVLAATALAQIASNPTALVREGMDAREAVKISDNIYQAVGFGNTLMIVTAGGNAIVDTSMPAPARVNVKLLKAKSADPVKYMML